MQYFSQNFQIRGHEAIPYYKPPPLGGHPFVTFGHFGQRWPIFEAMAKSANPGFYRLILVLKAKWPLFSLF